MPFAEPLTVAKTLTTIKEVAVDPDGALESRCLCRCCWSPHFVRLGLVTHAHCGCTSQWLRVRAHAMIGAATRRVQSAACSRSRARSRRAAHRGVTRGESRRAHHPVFKRGTTIVHPVFKRVAFKPHVIRISHGLPTSSSSCSRRAALLLDAR